PAAPPAPGAAAPPAPRRRRRAGAGAAPSSGAATSACSSPAPAPRAASAPRPARRRSGSCRTARRPAWPACWRPAGRRQTPPPSATLAMAALPAQPLHRRNQPGGQLGPRHALVAAVERPKEGVLLGPFQGVGGHQVGVGVPPRALGDLQQPLVADADLQLELDQ